MAALVGPMLDDADLIRKIEVFDGRKWVALAVYPEATRTPRPTAHDRSRRRQMANKSDKKPETNAAEASRTKKEKPQGSGSVGSHKPGGDGRGNKKVHEDHDTRGPRK